MNIIDRAKNIILQPVKEWDVIATETPDTAKIITGYVLPLAGAAAVAAFIGYGLIGAAFMSGTSWGIYSALRVLIGALLSVFISAFVIDALAPSFGSEKNFGKSLQLTAYSYTPAWIGGLLAIIPLLGIIGGLLGLYGLYLLYIGIPKMKNTPEDKQVGYFVVSLVVIIVVYIIIGSILAMILIPAFGLSHGIETIRIR